MDTGESCLVEDGYVLKPGVSEVDLEPLDPSWLLKRGSSICEELRSSDVTEDFVAA